MNIFMIVFNHHSSKPISLEEEYDFLLGEINSYENLFLSPSTYLIKTSDTEQEVYQKLYFKNARSFKDRDQLYVLSACQPFQGYGSEIYQNWFAENLPTNS
jgi:hypothetical protein